MKFTGFHPQGEEEREIPLDLTALIIFNPTLTIFALMAGDAMTDAKIHDGDLLVIEAAERYVSGQIVLAFVDGETVVRRLLIEQDYSALLPANQNFSVIELHQEKEWLIRGRVLAAITLLRLPRVQLPQVG